MCQQGLKPTKQETKFYYQSNVRQPFSYHLLIKTGFYVEYIQANNFFKLNSYLT